jgi:hypothetical protein
MLTFRRNKALNTQTSSVSDDGMVQTKVFSPVLDLAENTTVLRIESSSLIHIGPAAIAGMTLAGFSDLLGHAGQETASELFETSTPDPVCTEISATSSCHRFVRTLQTRTTASGKPIMQNVAFHVLVERVTGEEEEGEDDDDDEKTKTKTKTKTRGGPASATGEHVRIAFRTVTNAEAADLLPKQRRRKHVAAVRDMRTWLKSKDAFVEGKAPAEANDVSGTIAFDDRDFGCTQVTIEASIVVQTAGGGASGSSTKTSGVISRALMAKKEGGGGGGGDGNGEKMAASGSSSSFISSVPYSAAKMIAAATTKALFKARDDAAGEEAAEEGSNLSRSASGFSSGEHRLAKSILEHISTAALADLHARQARYAGVDSAQRHHFAKAEVLKAAPRLAAHETDFVNKMLASDSPLNGSEWKKALGGIGASMNIYARTEEGADGTTLTYNKIIAIMDVSAADVLARCWFFMSYENVREHRGRHGTLLRKEIPVPSSRSKITLSVQYIKTGLDNRVFPAIWCWREEGDGSFTLAFGELDEYSHLPADTPAGAAVSEARGVLKKSLDAAKAEIVSSRGFWRVKPLAPNVCEATYVAAHSLPHFVAASYTRRVLEDVIALQKKLARNGAVVDGELRAVFPDPPTLKELLAGGEPDVAEIIRNCEDLDFLHVGDNDWTLLRFDENSSPLVGKWIKYAPPKKGERTIAVGKANTVVDSSARNVFGWMADYCSRERTRIGAEDADLTRFVVERRTPHDFIAATVKKMPMWFSNREYVNRVICAVDEDTLEFNIFNHAVDVPIDHGLKTRTVRGKTTILAKIKPINETQCDATILMRAEPGGAIPSSIVNSKVSSMLNTVNELRAVFQRDDEIDRYERDELVRVIREDEQTYSAEEIAVEQRVRSKFASAREDLMEQVESPDDQTKVRKYSVGGQSGVFGMATAVIDASAEDCAAYQLAFMSRHNQRADFELAGMNRTLVKQNGHCSVIQAVYDVKVPGFQPREFVSLQVWRRELEDNSIVVVIDAVNLPDQFPVRPNIVRATTSIMWKMVPLPPIMGGVVQTRVTKFQQIDMKVAIPKFVVSKGGMFFFMPLVNMRKLFDRSMDVDEASRALIIERIEGHTDQYSFEDTRAVEKELGKFDIFEKKKSKKFDLLSPATEAKIVRAEGDQGGLWDSRRTYGLATTIVKARPVDVLSFFLDTTSSSNVGKDDLEKYVVEAPNGHSQLVYLRVAVHGALMADREFLSWTIWKKTDNGFVLITRPEESAGRERKSTVDKSAVRGQFPSAMKISRVSDSETRVEYIIHPRWGSSGAEWLFDRFVAARLERVTRVQQYFLELRTMGQYDAADGKAMGTRLMYPGGDKNKKPWEKVEDIVRKHRGLTMLWKEVPVLVALLQEIIKGELAFADSVSTKLECLSEVETRKIGRSLAPALKSRKTAEAGLYQWKHQNASVVELCEKHPWVESMLLEIARIVLNTAPWGLAWRVGFGASISQLDLWSDIAVIVEYLNTPGRAEFGVALLVMLGTCLVLQLLVVMGQNWKKKENLPMQMLIVVAGIKAPYDAWNVVRGKKQEEHQAFDAKSELAFTKAGEMFAESIPGCVLQLYVVLKFLAMGEQVSERAVFSIVLSALTTGYSSSTLTYDYDSDPSKRRTEPKFYGFIPDDARSRTLLLVVMTLNSALLLLVRSFGTALLLLTNARWFVLYTAGDVALYLVQKIARGDVIYWVPLDDTAAEIVVSLVMRITAKIIVDYTGVLQLRGSAELGGIYWSWSMLQAVTFSFAAAAVYLKEREDIVLAAANNSTTNSTGLDEGGDGEGGAAMQGDAVWGLVSSTSIVWLLSFAGILMLMKREYWATFLSFETGNEWVMSVYLKGDSDEVKGEIFRFNGFKWEPIREDVKAWTLANWWKWKREKPEWLTEALVGKIPDDFIPKEEDRKALEGARMSARLSIKGMLGVGGGEKGDEGRKVVAVRAGARVQAVS